MVPEQPRITLPHAAWAHVLNATLTISFAEKERVRGLCCSHTCTTHPSRYFRHFPSAQSNSSLNGHSRVLRLAVLLNPQRTLSDFFFGAKPSQGHCRPNQKLGCVLFSLYWITTDLYNATYMPGMGKHLHSSIMNQEKPIRWWLLSSFLKGWGAKINKHEYRPIFELPNSFSLAASIIHLHF